MTDKVNSIDWSPEVIVTLTEKVLSFLSDISWPLVVIGILFLFRKEFSNLIEGLRLTELKVGKEGFEFKAGQPSGNINENINSSPISKNIELERVRKAHKSSITDHTKGIIEKMKTNLDMMLEDNQEKIQLLLDEAGILQERVSFYEINRSIFKSQYILLKEKLNVSPLDYDELKRYYTPIRKEHKLLLDIELDDYLVFLTSYGLVEQKTENGKYEITPFGKSYLNFLNLNPNLTDNFHL